mgnify:CR=1 FL=1
MSISEALESILDLAKESVISEMDARDNDILEERKRCIEAIKMIEDFIPEIVSAWEYEKDEEE